MIKKDNQKLSLHQPATYEIKIPGVSDGKWLDWNGGLKIAVENDKHGNPITILTITVDQAALHGLLDHLYSLGLPLISVLCVDNK